MADKGVFNRIKGSFKVGRVTPEDIIRVTQEFKDSSKIPTFIQGAEQYFTDPHAFNTHVPAYNDMVEKLKEYYPQERTYRSPRDKAANYAGGYDYAQRIRDTQPIENAIRGAKAHQFMQYGDTPESQNDAVMDYLENKAGIEGAYSDICNKPKSLRDIMRDAVVFTEGQGYAQGGDVDSALSDYAQLLDAYPNARKFLSSLGKNVEAVTPTQSQMSSPETALETALNFAPMGMAGVIKAKGGNWRSGQIEREIEPMKAYIPSEEMIREAGMNPDVPARHASLAMNRWLDTKLAKYIKNEMGTPEDPVRALAEKGILHINPEDWYHTQNLAAEGRKWGGHSPEPVATTELGKKWENIADASIIPYPAKRYQVDDKALHIDPWLSKIDPESLVYEPALNKGTLGIGHLTDELHNAIRKESDLPEHLRLDYSKLDKVSVPQAVELVDKINKYRAAEMARANLEKSRNAATVLHKDYPDQGLSWVELKHIPISDEERRAKGLLSDTEPNLKALEDALAYEGQSMGHCVGGYCPDVVSGKSRIFSLRDAKGEPHVTIETRPPELRGDMSFDDYLSEPHRIVQIKGKANRMPKERYLPAVQDFVRSGKWSDIGDSHNTGLSSEELRSIMNEPKFAAGGHVEFDPNSMQSIIDEFEQGEYGLRHDAGTALGDLLLKYTSQEPSSPEKPDNYAQGGAVQYDPARIDAIIAAIPKFSDDEIKTIMQSS